MTNLEKKFADLRAQNRKGVIIFVTAGAPDIETSIRAVVEAEKNGADIIEIGIPFSDPMADGPVILKASTVAVKNGGPDPAVNTRLKDVIAKAKQCLRLIHVASWREGEPRKVFDIIREIRKESQIPIVGMGYLNNLLAYGFEKFVDDAKSVGMDGVIVPDVPHEESELMRQICSEKNFHLMEFITPLTTPERMKETCTSANGFIYCVSNVGVTGVKELDYSQINSVMKNARQFTKIPLALGFGIGNAESAVAAAEEADAIIIGSAVVSRLMENKFGEAMKFIADIRSALDNHKF